MTPALVILLLAVGSAFLLSVLLTPMIVVVLKLLHRIARHCGKPGVTAMLAFWGMLLCATVWFSLHR